jgi:hypothetical protein
MDTFYKKPLLAISVMLFAFSVQAQQKVSKIISKDFTMAHMGKLRLDNKYGDVTITGWDKNKISIIVDITVIHKKKENAENLLKRISAHIKDQNGVTNVTSVIAEKSSGFFAKYFSLPDAFDFDRGNVQIDYAIHIPVNAKLDITNKFGDIFIEGWHGKLKVDLQHGDMRVNEDLNNADINIRYGNANVKAIDYANIHLKNSEIKIDGAKDLNINSSGSRIKVGQCTSLEIYSNKDVINIENVGTLLGSLKYSDMRLNGLSKSMDLDLKIADLTIYEIQNPQVQINLNQVSSEIILHISDFAFKFDAVLEQGLLRLPKSFDNVASKMLDKAKRIRKITATYGNNALGNISIKGEKGVILLKETPTDQNNERLKNLSTRIDH